MKEFLDQVNCVMDRLGVPYSVFVDPDENSVTITSDESLRLEPIAQEFSGVQISQGKLVLKRE